MYSIVIQYFYTLWKKVKVKLLSRVRLFATPRTVAYQAPPSMGFSRQEHWSGLPFPSPADLPNPGIEPRSPALQTDALPSEPPGKPYIMKWSQYDHLNDHNSFHMSPYKVISILLTIFPKTIFPIKFLMFKHNNYDVYHLLSSFTLLLLLCLYCCKCITLFNI